MALPSPSSPQTLELHRDGAEAMALGPSSGLLPKQAFLTAISQSFQAPAKPLHNRETESREEPDSKHPPPQGRWCSGAASFLAKPHPPHSPLWNKPSVTHLPHAKQPLGHFADLKAILSWDDYALPPPSHESSGSCDGFWLYIRNFPLYFRKIHLTRVSSLHGAGKGWRCQKHQESSRGPAEGEACALSWPWRMVWDRPRACEKGRCEAPAPGPLDQNLPFIDPWLTRTGKFEKHWIL